MLTLENISLKAGNFELKNVSFTVEKGEYFVLLGISGVGKSLLLESIAGLIKTGSGKIILRGVDVTKEKIQKRNISIVYQEADLFPHMSVYENIAYPLKSKKSAGIRAKVLNAAAQVGIADKLDRNPNTLSGGEYQRVALARSLAADNDIILLDEPLSSLDSKSKTELRALLRKLNRNGITIIHVTHDYEEAISLASKIGIMENGRLVQIAPPEEIFKHPKSEFVAGFTGIKNFFRGELTKIKESDLKVLNSKGLEIYCLADVEDGEAYLMIQPDDINISVEVEAGSTRNHFRGKITDIANAKLGLEIYVDIGREIVVQISADAKKSLQLEIGKEVWVNFKASSCKIYK